MVETTYSNFQVDDVLKSILPPSGVASGYSRYSVNTLQFPEKSYNLHYIAIALHFLNFLFTL